MRETFFLDGENCEDYGIRLQKPVFFSGAVSNVQTISIPGRNGNLHISDGTYKNVTATAECFSLQENVFEAAELASFWLNGKRGSRRLEVSDDPWAFRIARVVESPIREFRMRRLAPFSISFDCDPRRFLVDGEYPVAIDKNSSIFNPTGQVSLPLITVYGTSCGDITVNGITVEIKELSDYITLDCEDQDAYKESENKNRVIYAPDFPNLAPGENIITWTGGIESIQIIPRWWTL